jgi:hypothetical protein
MSLFNFVRGDKEVYQLEGLLIPKLNFSQKFGSSVKRRREDLALTHGSVSTTPKNKLSEATVDLKFTLPKEYLQGGIDAILNKLIEKEGKVVSLYWIGHDGFRGDGTELPYVKLYKTDMVLDSISIYGQDRTKGTDKELMKSVEIQLIFDKFFYLDITNQARIVDSSLVTTANSQWDVTTFDSGVAFGGGASTIASQKLVSTMSNDEIRKYFVNFNYARPKYPVLYKDFWFPIYSVSSQRWVRGSDPYAEIKDAYYTTKLNTGFISGTTTKNILDFNQPQLASVINYSQITPTSTAGTAPYQGSAAVTFDKAWDGNINTYFDAADSDTGYTQAFFSGGAVVKKIAYMPRVNWSQRMTGGKFQGSNNNTTWTDLHTIPGQPTETVFTEVVIANTTSYLYYRYQSPALGFCNVTDIKLYTASGLMNAGTTLPVDLTGSHSNDIIILEIDGAFIPGGWSMTLTNKTNNTSVSYTSLSSQSSSTTRNQIYIHTGQVFSKFGTVESSSNYYLDAPTGSMLEFEASPTNNNQLLELKVSSPLTCDLNVYVARTLY